jgi:hypothetical protein
MPGPIVRVTFNSGATPQFTFADDTVEMNAAGKIKLKQDTTDSAVPAPRWRFRGATIKDDFLNEFRTRVAKDGKSIDIMDDFLDERKTPYSYNITVELDGTTYTSPDPVIVNDPGSQAE